MDYLKTFINKLYLDLYNIILYLKVIRLEISGVRHLPLYFLFFFIIILRFEITEDPEKWLLINRETGEISARNHFNIRSPYIRKNKYKAGVKVTDMGECRTNLIVHPFILIEKIK